MSKLLPVHFVINAPLINLHSDFVRAINFHYITLHVAFGSFVLISDTVLNVCEHMVPFWFKSQLPIGQNKHSITLI